MTLEELKIRLKITDSSQDDYLAVCLEDAIEYVKSYCNNDFRYGLPSAVKTGIALLVKSMGEDKNTVSQSLGDMAKSFNNAGTTNEAHLYFKPFKKVRMI